MVTLPTPGRKADIMKKSVLVVFGGQSSEHIVSCMSAINVIKNIDTERYDVTLIGITEEGKWLLYGELLSGQQRPRPGVPH